MIDDHDPRADPPLYDRMPEVHRTRDAELGFPLRALLRALGDQVADETDAISRLYDNWFIETCDASLVPAFAELVGLALDPPGVDAEHRRRQVADALATRRRKGTLSVLEDLALEATGWPARALELGSRTAATASVRFPELRRRPLLDLSDGEQLEPLAGTAMPALADVRRISSARRVGAGNLATVAVAVWRLVAEGVEQAPAANVQDSNHYTFDPLGRDRALCVRPSRRNSGAAPALDLDVPAPIGRLALERNLEDYYGPGRSIQVYRGGHLVPHSAIVVADLGGWYYRTPPGRVSIDPVLGRISFPSRHAPEEGVFVTCSTLSMGVIGGGHYERPASPPIDEDPLVLPVRQRARGGHRSIGAALGAWRGELGAGRRAAVIEIADDGVYAERLHVRLGAGERLEIRAAPGCRPILLPTERYRDEPDVLRIAGPDRPGDEDAGARGPVAVCEADLPVVTFDGVWIAGHPVRLAGQLGTVTFRHCTLVPASGTVQLQGRHDGRDRSLLIAAMPCTVAIRSSVVGRICVTSDEVGFEPVPLTVEDSVVDASEPAGRAIAGADDDPAWVALTLKRSTVLGGVAVTAVGLIEDSILTAALRCERRQQGAVRFSWVPLGSRTPARTGCHPPPAADPADVALLEPRFDSVRWGEAAYARLARDAPQEIVRGAHDEGELGVYHDLFDGQRAADLRARLREFAPAGIDIDIRFST